MQSRHQRAAQCLFFSSSLALRNESALGQRLKYSYLSVREIEGSNSQGLPQRVKKIVIHDQRLSKHCIMLRREFKSMVLGMESDDSLDNLANFWFYLL